MTFISLGNDVRILNQMLLKWPKIILREDVCLGFLKEIFGLFICFM